MLFKIIVFGPLIGALIAGFFGRKIGDKPSMAITTFLLFLSAYLIAKPLQHENQESKT